MPRPLVSDIQYFHVESAGRADNDSHNKIRENIIENMPLIDASYFADPVYGEKWRTLKTNFDLKMAEICPSYDSYKIQHRAGRRFNYDFDITFTGSLVVEAKLEFKFNASSIDEAPQFVSPMKPSQYLSQPFEDYYYINYLVPLLTQFALPVPDKETYLKTIHNNKPKSMVAAQSLYYQGCPQSSQYTGTETAVNFYKQCNEKSRECIANFIGETELDVAKLNSYLLQSQDEKIYLLYKDNSFHLQYSNSDDYVIETCEKQPEKFRYLATTKTNNKIKILLRWKNGNGIAYPAFQIS
jgi:hypothetical protein